MLLDKNADVYRARNINDDADLVALKVVSGPSGGSFAAFWGYCIQSKTFQLDISSLPSYGLTTVGQCEVHPSVQPDDAISSLDQRSFLKQMIEYPRHMLWHPLGRTIVVAELGVLYIFNLVWHDKQTNERMGMVEAARRIMLMSTGNYATNNSMDDDMVPAEMLSVEIKQVKQLNLHVTAVSLLFPSNGLLLGTSNDTVLTLDWEGNHIPYLATDSRHHHHHHHHEDQKQHGNQPQSPHWVDNDRAIQCLWRPSVFPLRATHGLHSQRRHHHHVNPPSGSSAEHLTDRDCSATPDPHPYPYPLYSSTEEVIREIVCDNRSQMMVVLFSDGSFSLSVQSSRAAGATAAGRSPVTSGTTPAATTITTGAGGAGDPHFSMMSSTNEHEAGRDHATGGSQGDSRLSFTCTDRIHPVALVAYPFDDAPSAAAAGKTVGKRPSIYELARDRMMMMMSNSSSSSLDGGDLRTSIYRSSDYVSSHDVDYLLQLTPTLHKKVCRMRSLVTGHSKEELSSVLTMALIDDDNAGPLSSTGDEPPVITTTTTTSSSATTTTTSSSSAVPHTYPMPVWRTRLLVLMRTKHLLATTEANDNDIINMHQHHPHHHHSVHTNSTSSVMHGNIIGRRRPLSYSLVVLEFIVKGNAPISSSGSHHPPSSSGGEEVVGKCTQSVCVGRTYSSDDDDDESIDRGDNSHHHHLEIIRLSQCDARGLYALLLCNGIITCRPLLTLHSILFTLDTTSYFRLDDDASSLKRRRSATRGLHTINVSVSLSTVIVSVWGQYHHHHHHNHHSSSERQGDSTVKQEAIIAPSAAAAAAAAAESKIFVLSMSTALHCTSTAGAGSSQSEGVFVDYSKGQLSFVGPSMTMATAGSSMGDGFSAYCAAGGGDDGDDTTGAGTANISDDCYRLLRLPARLRVDVSWYQHLCSFSSAQHHQQHHQQHQQHRRGIRRPSLRYCTYCRALCVVRTIMIACSRSTTDLLNRSSFYLSLSSLYFFVCNNMHLYSIV